MKDGGREAQRQWQHPAALALAAALKACDGALQASEVSVTACLYPDRLRQTDPGPWSAQHPWGHNDLRLIYPASVMKLFVLAAMTELQKAGRFEIGPEERRAASTMIRQSSNEATAYLMGCLSGAFDGPELGAADLADWLGKRAVVQDLFRGMGPAEYRDLQLLHATYQDSPYGCALQARQPGNGNLLTARAAAVLMHDIARGAMAGHDWMMELLDREFQRVPGFHDPEGDQVRGFLAQGLPPEVKVWSKAGHTSKTRHDLLYAECPDGRSFVLSVMTEGAWSSANEIFLPSFARQFHRLAFGTDLVGPNPGPTGGAHDTNDRQGGTE